MPIRKSISGNDHEFLVSDRLDGAAANQLELEILEAIRAGADNIYVNLAEATFLCSAGIRVLMQYFRQMKAKGKNLCVTRPSPQTSEALEMTGFKDLIVEKI